MQITDFTSGLELRDGIYFAKTNAKISYPEKGNEVLFDIEENSFWFRHRNKIIPGVVKRYAQNKVFFDVGGGNGFVAKAIESESIETVLVEPGVNGCLNARKRKLDFVVCATLQEAGFKDSSLPAVGLFDVVEHIEKDVDFLKMIHRYITNDGRVFITVPAYGAIWSNEDKDAGHFRRYTLKSMTRKLDNAGFEVIYSTYIFSILPLPIFFFRSLPSRFGFHKNSDDPQKYKDEHTVKKGMLDKLMNWFWQKEITRISNGRKIPFGSSCLFVAKKNLNNQ